MFYHILFECPRLGLYKEGEEGPIMEELRSGIIKQLSEMSLKKFKEYCEVRKYKTDIQDKDGAIPLRYNKQESDSDFKKDSEYPNPHS